MLTVLCSCNTLIDDACPIRMQTSTHVEAVQDWPDEGVRRRVRRGPHGRRGEVADVVDCGGRDSCVCRRSDYRAICRKDGPQTIAECLAVVCAAVLSDGQAWRHRRESGAWQGDSSRALSAAPLSTKLCEPAPNQLTVNVSPSLRGAGTMRGQCERSGLSACVYYCCLPSFARRTKAQQEACERCRIVRTACWVRPHQPWMAA